MCASGCLGCSRVVVASTMFLALRHTSLRWRSDCGLSLAAISLSVRASRASIRPGRLERVWGPTHKRSKAVVTPMFPPS
jgi:hypothetical protein